MSGPGIAISAIDTDRFRARIARVRLDSPADVGGVLRQADELAVSMLVARVDAGDAPTIHAVEAAGGRLCDTLVYYACVVGARERPAGVRPATPADADRIVAIAAAAFADYVGHYHNDARLDRAAADATYPDWARRSVTEDGVVDRAWVVEDDGVVAGFLTLRVNDGEETEIVLNAVVARAPASRPLPAARRGRPGGVVVARRPALRRVDPAREPAGATRLAAARLRAVGGAAHLPRVARMTSYDRAVYARFAEVEEGSFWFQARNALIVWAIGRYAPAGWSRLLEVGCGTGFVLREIRRAYPTATLHGSDLFAEGLAFAAERVPDARLERLDLLDLPYRDAFDVVGAFDVIEHIDDDTGALRGIASAVRPGGLVLLTVPQHPALWSDQDVAAHHVRRYVAAELHRKVRGAGLDVVRTTSFVSLLLPALVATRRMPNRTTLGDLERPRLVNAGLGAVMAVERAAIRAGASFPAGGSRLVVARRPPAPG